MTASIHATTIDDLLRDALEAITKNGHKNTATKGSHIELTGVLLELSNPRARLSRTETRGKLFSCLGELCWYLSGSNSLDFISYYVSKYEDFAEDGVLAGAYGPRLHGERKQIHTVIEMLKKKPGTRQAVIQLFEFDDLMGSRKDVPCTCNLQFLLRDGRLHLVTYMRSNDIYLGFPHDVFAFTMLQELVSCSIGADLGTYRHMVGSLHLYDEHFERAQSFVREGFQSTESLMPAMPAGDPWSSVASLLCTEEQIRVGRDPLMPGLADYWTDLIRLLQIFRISKSGIAGDVSSIRTQMSSCAYNTFIDVKLRAMARN